MLPGAIGRVRVAHVLVEPDHAVEEPHLAEIGEEAAGEGGREVVEGRPDEGDGAADPGEGRKDGRGTRGLAVPKTNWANTIDQGPFEAYAVTCGLTFTFGGLKISNEGEVENTDGHAIPGLFAAGELVGGLFYHNYPGGTGLVSGAVLGKLAGDGAGRYVAGKN